VKFTLKDYQDEAVRDSLLNLSKACRRWHEDSDIHSFSLTATTGAGKTVMAAAVFEALFHGDDDLDFEADPGAVVIWFSDDPSLNEQTRFRLIEASDRLLISNLVVVESSFNRERFEPGKVYFLNTQKLSRNSLLVRGHDPEVDEERARRGELFPETRPDARSHTIWDTIKNTVEDPELTLYLVLDEAHRGMGATRGGGERSTIVKRLINGHGAVPAIPVVWGISATVERFNDAMEVATGRSTLPNVVVDAKKVQESGLLKDTIVLETPDETGRFDSVLMRRGTEKLKKISEAWTAYAEDQDDAKLVQPLMVFQVPNTPDQDDIGRALDIIFDTWPELPSDCIAHVFGEHKDQRFGGRTVSYISPERVQDASNIRILVAKDAISTGWDCPRAEVMVSFRPATDRTHITQLLGRMVRTPLARRIPGNDQLNSVDCLLPFFDTDTVTKVVDSLMRGGDDDGQELPGRRILINPKEMLPNPDMPEAVWSNLLCLPSQSLPQKSAKPVRRLTLLAHELANDGLLANAGKLAHAELYKILNGAKSYHATAIASARAEVLKVEGQSVTVAVGSGDKSFNAFVDEADIVVIEDAFRRAARVLSPDVARTYAEYLADQNEEDESDEALLDAHTEIAGMGLVPQIKDILDEGADQLAREWLANHKDAIKALTHDRQEVYRNITSMSSDPQDIDLTMPEKWLEPTTILEEDGATKQVPLYNDHLLCDEDGKFPAVLNGIENAVLSTEGAREDFVGWYRNPPRATQDSIGAAYKIDGEYSIVRPDFVFFAKGSDGDIVADLIDPHGAFLADAIPKLKGLAAYAETHPGVYRRIEAVDEIEGKLRVLDLTNPKVRNAIANFGGDTATALYQSEHGRDYPI